MRKLCDGLSYDIINFGKIFSQIIFGSFRHNVYRLVSGFKIAENIFLESLEHFRTVSLMISLESMLFSFLARACRLLHGRGRWRTLGGRFPRSLEWLSKILTGLNL